MWSIRNKWVLYLWKNEISEMKNLLEAVKSRIHLAEVMTSELETIARNTEKKLKQKIDWKKKLCKGLVIPEINTSGPNVYWESYKGEETENKYLKD